MEKSELRPCIQCFGKGKYEGTYGRTFCGGCDGTGKVSKQTRKDQLKKIRDLMKTL